MRIVQNLWALALRQVVGGACKVVGFRAGEEAVGAVTHFVGERLNDQSRRLQMALGIASERAWKALEIALAGESLLDWLRKAEDRAFADQIRSYLHAQPLSGRAGHPPEFLRQCLRELRAARTAGVLAGMCSPAELARQVGAFARFDDPQKILAAEQDILEGVADDLKDRGYPALGRLVGLPVSEGRPLLAVAVRYFFRRHVENDPTLFQGLAFNQLEQVQEGQEEGFAALTEQQKEGFTALAAALDQHGDRLEGLLVEVRDVVIETHADVKIVQSQVGQTREDVLDVKAQLSGFAPQLQDIGQSVLKLLEQHELARRELYPQDSLSIRSDHERALVKELVARYRALPEAERRVPALLNALGKLEVVAGDFDAAQRDFQEVATLVASPLAQAEARHNAYRAALERRDWDTALAELRQAVALDEARFAPFPFDKYEPQRILGAGGFGVAFLCQHTNSGIPLVVKTLGGDERARDVGQVFNEARILETLEHPAIIRLRDCDFADRARKKRPYLVMDYFDGVTLEHHVKENGPLTPPELLPLARAVADGLQAAHAKGVLHRDIKPANLLVRRDSGGWRVKLIDFGLALRPAAMTGTVNNLAATTDKTLAGSSIAGTLEYAAPEQMGRLPGTPVGAPADVYSFGKTCCYALFKTPLPTLKHWRSAGEGLADLLGQCLEESPRDRPPSFAEVQERLQAAGSARQAAAVVAPLAAVAYEGGASPEVQKMNRLAYVIAWIYLGAMTGAALGWTAGFAKTEVPRELERINWIVLPVWALLGGLSAMFGFRKLVARIVPDATGPWLTFGTLPAFVGGSLLAAALAAGITAIGTNRMGFFGALIAFIALGAMLGFGYLWGRTGAIERAATGAIFGSLGGAALGVFMYATSQGSREAEMIWAVVLAIAGGLLGLRNGLRFSAGPRPVAVAKADRRLSEGEKA